MIDVSKVSSLELLHQHDRLAPNLNGNEILARTINSMKKIKMLKIHSMHISLAFLKGLNHDILNQLTSFDFNSHPKIISIDAVNYLTTYCRNSLTVLNMRADSDYVPAHFRSILKKCTSLQEFSIYCGSGGWFYYVTNRYKVVGRRCHCVISRVPIQSRAQLESLVDLIKSSQIRIFDLCEAPGFTVYDFKEVLCNRSDVEVIMLSNLFTPLTYEVLCSILQTCPNLKDLGIWDSLHNTTSKQIQLAFTNTPKKLTHLQIEDNIILTTKAANAILLANPQIVEFRFRDCPLVETNLLVRESKSTQ